MNKELDFRGAARQRQQSEDDESIVDLRAHAKTLWRGKWIILICGLFGIAIGFLYASQIQPRYQATAKLLLGTEQADVMRNEGVMVDSRFGPTTIMTHTEILGSTKLINRVIDALRLDDGPVEADPAPELSPLQNFLIDIGLKSQPPPELSAEEAAQMRRLSLIERIEAGMTLDAIPDSRVIAISFTSGNPRLSAQIANEIAQQYLVDQLEGRLETTRNAVDWLASRVEELRIKVEDSERAVEDAYARLSTETGQSLDVTKQQSQALNTTLITTRQDLANLEAQYQRLSAALAAGRDLATLTEFRDSQVVTNYRRRESDLLAELAALESTVPAGHPALQRLPARARLEAQLAETRQSIHDEAARIVQALEVDLDAKRGEEESLVAEIRGLDDKAAEQARDVVEIRQLEREAEASRILYENLLSRLQESSAEVSLQSADARVITPAEVPAGPLATSALRAKQIATILGLMAGVGIVLLLDRLNNTFRSPQQLEQITGLNLLGTIPSAGKRLKRSDVIAFLSEKSNSALTEAIRNLRTSILFSNVDNPPKIVMFTSSVPREGKSTTSMLMALTSQQMGKSAIIVDCDLRMPALSKVLDVGDDEMGLLSVLKGSASLEQATFTEPRTGLHILMSKSSERNLKVNAADVLASNRFRDLLRVLATRYDLVILDAPPTLVVTDARILASMADAVVYAVRWDSTPRDAVEQGLQELQSVRAKLTGVVMTMVNEAKASRYSYDGYNYYRGRYRDYYES